MLFAFLSDKVVVRSVTRLQTHGIIDDDANLHVCAKALHFTLRSFLNCCCFRQQTKGALFSHSGTTNATFYYLLWDTIEPTLEQKVLACGDGKREGAAGAFLDTFLLTVCQCDGAFLRIDREQATLVANVSLRDEADLRAKLRHSRTHCNSSYYLALRCA